VAFAVGAYLLIRHFDLEAVAAALEPLGRHWYALPLAVLAFVVLSMLMLSVLAMTVIAGWVFGPWLGSVCGLAGSLCSAATAFWIGRRLGQTAIEKLGARVRNISRDLGENGVLAAFLLRKIPAPFTIVNMIAGASRIRFRDFMLGTLLGMGAVVVLLAVFGDGLRQGLQGGSPTGPVLATGAALLVVAIVLNAVVKRRRRRAP
jgi:uncharacterized membrane protein YdjX (TVP38/TMEM64 family)